MKEVYDFPQSGVREILEVAAKLEKVIGLPSDKKVAHRPLTPAMVTAGIKALTALGFSEGQIAALSAEVGQKITSEQYKIG